MAFTIEVCVDSVESAVAAVRGGADRLELCGNLGLGGGTTPSMGLFKLVKRACSTARIMIMIRPRTGDFHYTLWEVDTMVEDIRAFKAAGAHGVVFGALDALGRVDVKTTSRLTREALPMEVCFHRAFDMTDDAIDEYHKSPEWRGFSQGDAVNDGLCARIDIYFSGLGQKVVTPESLEVIKNLLEQAATLETERGLTILPGSGINPATVQDVLSALHPHGLKEIHLSAGSWIPSAMRFRKKDMGMGVGGAGEWGIWRTSQGVVRSVREIVDEAVPPQNEANQPEPATSEESPADEAGPSEDTPPEEPVAPEPEEEAEAAPEEQPDAKVEEQPAAEVEEQPDADAEEEPVDTAEEADEPVAASGDDEVQVTVDEPNADEQSETPS